MAETEIIFAVQESPEGGYEAGALGHSIFTQAETIQELHTMIRGAIRCHFESELPYRIVGNRGSSSVDSREVK